MVNEDEVDGGTRILRGERKAVWSWRARPDLIPPNGSLGITPEHDKF